MAFSPAMMAGMGPNITGLAMAGKMLGNRQPATKPKADGFMGLDPMTWLQISGALAKGAAGEGWGGAAEGIVGALDARKSREEDDGRSDAQRRALLAMQMGDTAGAAQILASAKGLEADALNYQTGLEDRAYREKYDDKIYGRTRADQEADDRRQFAREGWGHIRDRTEQLADQKTAMKHDLKLAGMKTQTANWEKITDKDGKVWWTVPGTNMRVDSGLEAPGAQSRSLLGAETAARAYAGIPGAMEAINRMETMELGGKDKDGKTVAPYDPQADWGARAVQSIPFVPGMKELGSAWGGEDFQAYEQAFKQFEATMMPIMSGAAVSESEAERLLQAVQPRMEDGKETLAYKRDQRRRMVEALRAAAEGDRTNLNSMLAGNMPGGPAAAGAEAGARTPPQMQLPKDLPRQLAQVLDPQDVLAWSTYSPEEKTFLANQVASKMGMTR